MDEETMITGAEGIEETQAAGAEEQAGAQGEQSEEIQDQPEKKYTDADVDRIVAKKIAAERKRIQKLFKAEQQESEIEKRERDVTRRELMADAKDALVSDGLPSSLAKVTDYSDKEAYEKSYEEVTGIFREAMQQEYTRWFSGRPPRASTGDRGFVQISREKALSEAFAPPKR